MADAENTFRSIKRHIFTGSIVTFCFLGALIVWATVTNIAGAVIAHGVIVVRSHPKKVQHPAGGVVREILVRNGAFVNAGQTMLLLDDTVISANLAMVR